jgi:hypothetical protein
LEIVVATFVGSGSSRQRPRGRLRQRGSQSPEQVLTGPLPRFISETYLGSGAGFQLDFMGPAGYNYTLWGSIDPTFKPVQTTWSMRATGTFTGGTDTYTDPNGGTGEQQFYLLTVMSEPGSRLCRLRCGWAEVARRWPILALTSCLLAAWAHQTRASAASTNASAPPLKYEAPTLLTGTIYARNSSNVLFKFKRTATQSGTKISVVREYSYPDGKPAAREVATYDGDDLVSFGLEEMQIGAAGRAIIRREPGKPLQGTVAFEYTKDLASGAKPKTSTEALRSDTLTSDMVAAFLASHWAELAKGQKVKCRYVVVPRRETVGFAFAKESDTIYQGRKAVILRMEATSPIIARLVDPLYFTIEAAAPYRVFQFVGRMTPKLKVGSAWEDLDGLMVFDWPNH